MCNVYTPDKQRQVYQTTSDSFFIISLLTISCQLARPFCFVSPFSSNPIFALLNLFFLIFFCIQHLFRSSFFFFTIPKFSIFYFSFPFFSFLSISYFSIFLYSPFFISLIVLMLVLFCAIFWYLSFCYYY